MLSLGDIFGDDHTPLTTTSADMDALHKDYRQYLGQICHSIPFYVCLGNHEGENDYYLNPNGIYTTADTGLQNISIGWNSFNGGSDSPGTVWNPNVSDDGRSQQHSSDLTIMEVVS
jgi:hypothetical protein